MNRWWFSSAVAAMIFCLTGLSSAEEASTPDAGPEEERSAEDEARREGVLAKVGDIEITVGDFEDRLNKQGPFRRVQYSAPEKRREFLQQMIDWELQAHEADERGLGDDDAVSDQMKRVMSSLLLRREVDDRVRPTDVTDEEMHAYYDEHLSTFQRPERVRAYHIVISDRTKAQDLLARVSDGETDTREFRRLARELSEDPVTKRRGGDLRYFTRPEDRADGDPEVPAEVVSATFELLEKRRAVQKSGGKAGPDARRGNKALEGFNPIYPKLVKTSQGYHIIRFMGHREEVNRSFEEVERQIRNRIWREKLQKSRETFIEGLREAHPVEVNEENLDLVKVSTTPRGLKRGMPPGKRGIRPSGPRPGHDRGRSLRRGEEGEENEEGEESSSGGGEEEGEE